MAKLLFCILALYLPAASLVHSNILLPTTFNEDLTVGTQVINTELGRSHFAPRFNIKQTRGYGQRAVTCGNRVVVTGGFDEVTGADSIIHDTVQIFYPRINATRQAIPLYVGRAFHSVICRDDKFVIACGGVNSSFVAIASCESYDMAKDTWTHMPQMPYRLSYHQAVYVKQSRLTGDIERMYILGGLDALVTSSSSRVFYFDFIGSKWVTTTLADRSMTQSRYSFGVTLFNNKDIIVCGGAFYNVTANQRYSLSSCEKHTVEFLSIQWKAIAPLTAPRSDFGMVQVNSEVYVIGGACVNSTMALCSKDTRANGMMGSIDVLHPNDNTTLNSDWKMAYPALVPSAVLVE